MKKILYKVTRFNVGQKTALKTMNQIPVITAQIVESSRLALYRILNS